MKKIIIPIILIIIILISAIAFTNLNQNKYNYEIEKVNEYNYYISKQDDKYGVIEKDGKTLIGIKYENIIIPNPEKDIFICYTNQKPEVLNSKSEKLFTEYEEISPIKLKDEASTLTYEKSVLTYKKDGLYGLIDFTGKEITKNIYESIENLQPTEGKFLVTKNNKYGVIDLKGNILVNTEYDKITSDEYYTKKDEYKKSGFIVSNKTDDGFKNGYISFNGKKVLDTKYNKIERISKEDEKNIYLITSENGKVGLCKNSKNIITNEYQDITYCDTDVLILQKNKKYGVASIEGKTLIDTQYDEITSKGIYLYAQKETENKVYDSKGNVVDINYNKTIYETENPEYRISTILNNNITYYGIINKNGEKLVDENYRYIEYLYKNYFIATNENGKLGVINSNGKNVLDMKYSSCQKIKGKNIIQASEENSGISEFYSSDMREIIKITKPTVRIEDEYIEISNDEEKIYLDNDGNKIQDTSSLKKQNYPEEIGEYKKEQITLENVYYIKK